VRPLQSPSQEKPKPTAELWVDERTYSLQQVHVHLPTRGGTRTVTEQYRTAKGQPTPILAPLTALPLDLPAFMPAEAKAMHDFAYEAIPGGRGEKQLGEIGFVFPIRQNVGPADRSRVKSLLTESNAKRLKSSPIREFRLTTLEREVLQVWQQGQPWPVFADNGLTTTQLLSVTRVEAKENTP